MKNITKAGQEAQRLYAEYGQNPDDELRLQALQEGSEAFTAVYNATHGHLLASALVLTHNSHEAEELVQITYLKALDRLGQFRSDSEMETWLYSIMFNTFRDRFRVAQVRSRRLLEMSEGTIEAIVDHSRDTDPVSSLLEAEAIAEFEADLQEIPVGMAEAVRLQFFEDLSMGEIAARLDRSEGTAKSQSSRGWDRIRELREERRRANSSDLGGLAIAGQNATS